MIGETVGSYRIVDRIAVGGMGTVFRAEHALIGRVAAVKILHPEMSGNREIVNRFFNEAKATTTIKHPGIVEIFDFGYMPSGHAFLVMEFLEGEPLSHRMRTRGPMTEGEAAMMMRGVCSALAAAHAKGIVHRDLKPDNIFVVPDPDAPLGERTKVLDFGIAKLTDIGLAGSQTKTGAVMGTPTYMSPEQCRGSGDVDHRADLYSIGCILYELVSGRPPFINTGAGELIGSHLFVEPEPLSRHIAVTPEFEQLVMSLLAKRPEQRVQTAIELAQRLIAIAQQHGWIAVSATDPASRMSMQQIIPPSALGGIPTSSGATVSRPMITPAYPTPYAGGIPHAAQGATEVLSPPSYVRAPTPLPMQLQEPKPTTLSGAASQTLPPTAPRSRKGVWIGGGLMLAIGAAVAAFVGVSGGSSDQSAATPTSQPTTETVKMTDTPPPTPPPTTAPPPPPTTADTTKPATTSTTPIAQTKPDKPVKPVKPTGTGTPRPVKPTKPDKPVKPVKPVKPDKPGGDLLETDID